MEKVNGLPSGEGLLGYMSKAGSSVLPELSTNLLLKVGLKVSLLLKSIITIH